MIDEAAVSFFMGVLEKANSMVQHVDVQTNILITVGTAVFVFATTKIDSTHDQAVFLALGVFSALSAIVGLFALHPPLFMLRKGQKESVIFPSHIAQHANAEQYIATMMDTTADQDSITEACSRELYNISRYYYVPKRKLYRLSRNLLLIGIVISLAIFVILLR